LTGATTRAGPGDENESGDGFEEAEKRVRDIWRATRRQYSAEEKVRIMVAGLRGEHSIAELCRKEGAEIALASAKASVCEIVQGGSGDHLSVARHDIEQFAVDRFTEEQHGRTFRTAKFHMKLAGWGLSLEAWPACLVEGLGRNRLNDMVLALEVPSCGAA